MSDCTTIEERIQAEYKAIKLPVEKVTKTDGIELTALF